MVNHRAIMSWGQKRNVVLKTLLKTTSIRWRPTLSHTDVVFAPHLVIWDLVILDVGHCVSMSSIILTLTDFVKAQSLVPVYL